jgi:hypothetical protein
MVDGTVRAGGEFTTGARLEWTYPKRPEGRAQVQLLVERRIASEVDRRPVWHRIDLRD